MEQEVWKEIEGYEGIYEVSSLGRVKSLPRPYRKKELILTPTSNGTGYLIVGLRKDKRLKSLLVHRLVLQAFDPVDSPKELEGNHKDFNVTNNRLDNLEWVTTQENRDHFWSSGRKPDATKTTGESHHLSSLTDEDVIRFRTIHKETGCSVNGLAVANGVPESTMRLIIGGKTWKHLL